MVFGFFLSYSNQETFFYQPWPNQSISYPVLRLAKRYISRCDLHLGERVEDAFDEVGGEGDDERVCDDGEARDGDEDVVPNADVSRAHRTLTTQAEKMSKLAVRHEA